MSKDSNLSQNGNNKEPCFHSMTSVQPDLDILTKASTHSYV